ncbi:MAG: potassium channel family protein [Gammaproteobacteria bacterium]
MFYALATIAMAVVLAVASVLIHYECLRFLDRIIERLGPHRRKLIATMIGLLMAHTAEIWFYAGAYTLLHQFPAVGAIHMDVTNGGLHLLDAVYYSAMVYTTVGFGDMLPRGGLRLITATEALVGLSLITWSASFTYFQMQAVFGQDQT